MVGHGHPSVPPVPSPDEIEIIDLTSDNEEDMMGYETGTGTEAESWAPPSSPPATEATIESLWEVSNVKVNQKIKQTYHEA